MNIQNNKEMTDDSVDVHEFMIYKVLSYNSKYDHLLLVSTCNISFKIKSMKDI